MGAYQISKINARKYAKVRVVLEVSCKEIENQSRRREIPCE